VTERPFELLLIGVVATVVVVALVRWSRGSRMGQALAALPIGGFGVLAVMVAQGDVIPDELEPPLLVALLALTVGALVAARLAGRRRDAHPSIRRH
jgi:hypothetical protein